MADEGGDGGADVSRTSGGVDLGDFFDAGGVAAADFVRGSLHGAAADGGLDDVEGLADADLLFFGDGVGDLGALYEAALLHGQQFLDGVGLVNGEAAQLWHLDDAGGGRSKAAGLGLRWGGDEREALHARLSFMTV